MVNLPGTLAADLQLLGARRRRRRPDQQVARPARAAPLRPAQGGPHRLLRRDRVLRDRSSSPSAPEPAGSISRQGEPAAAEQGRQVLRHRRDDLEPLAGRRMEERQPPGVERLAGEVAAGRGDPRVRDPLPARLAVERIADDRPPLRLEVDADLVGAPGDQPAAQEASGRAASAEPPVEGDALLPLRFRGHPPLAVGGIAEDPELDPPVSAKGGVAVDHGEVVLLGAAARAGSAPGRRGSPASWPTSSTPEVSRSSRLTSPGRRPSPQSRARQSRALIRVPSRWPRRGMDDDARAACRAPGGARPRRARRAASPGRRSRAAPAAAAGRSRSGRPATTRLAGLAASAPLTRTSPSPIHPWMRARVTSGRSARWRSRTRSSRSRSSPRSVRKVRRSRSGIAAATLPSLNRIEDSRRYRPCRSASSASSSLLAASPRSSRRPPGFDARFTGRTLRFDYFHGGIAKEEHVSLDKLRLEGDWPGSRVHLLDDSNLGKYRLRGDRPRHPPGGLDARLLQHLRRVGDHGRGGRRHLADVPRVDALPRAARQGPAGAREARRGRRLPRDLLDGRRSGRAASSTARRSPTRRQGLDGLRERPAGGQGRSPAARRRLHRRRDGEVPRRRPPADRRPSSRPSPTRATGATSTCGRSTSPPPPPASPIRAPATWRRARSASPTTPSTPSATC